MCKGEIARRFQLRLRDGDHVCMFKMLLVGYLYGIKSERRLEEKVRLNLVYRWFCGFELDEAIPAHSTKFFRKL